MIRSSIGRLLSTVVDATLDRLGGSRSPPRPPSAPPRPSAGGFGAGPLGAPAAGAAASRLPLTDGAFASGAPGTSPEPRRVIALRPIEARPPAPEGEGVRVLAHPSADGRQCTFELSQPVLPGLSWRFADATAAAGSDFGRLLFEHPEVAWAEVHDAVVRVARRSGKEGDWRPLAETLGATLRAALGESVLPRGIVPPDEAQLAETIQGLIDDEVNPGLAAHSGHVVLRRAVGNTLYLEMGGGCQGCSAAALTLKVGIYNAFRAAVPGLGVIYDLTDHAAGTAPYLRDEPAGAV